jgi:two-component system phosphate regulon response regulator OmpR
MPVSREVSYRVAAMKGRILVVEDDPRTSASIALYLRHDGFDVVTAGDGPSALARAGDAVPDLMVLDLMLPREDGLAACRRMRAANENVPIIMLTAKGDDVDRIVGLEVGADDYLAKPFNPRELVARIHAVLRRQGARVTPGAPTEEPAQVAFGPYALDLSTRQLTRAGEPIALTTGEFSLLKALALHPRQPMSRDKLMELARGRELESTDRSIDVQVSRLRKLLAEDPQNPRYIQTVWGFGYVFVPDGAVTR